MDTIQSCNFCFLAANCNYSPLQVLIPKLKDTCGGMCASLGCIVSLRTYIPYLAQWRSSFVAKAHGAITRVNGMVGVKILSHQPNMHTSKLKDACDGLRAS